LSGVLVEIYKNGMARHIKAPTLDQTFIDIKAKAVETYEGACAQSMEELLNNILEAHPLASDWIRPTDQPGAYWYDKTVIDQIPELDWHQLFNVPQSGKSKPARVEQEFDEILHEC